MKRVNLIKTLLIGVPLVCGTIMTTACGGVKQNKPTKFDPWNLSTWGSKKDLIIKDAGINPNINVIDRVFRIINSAARVFGVNRNINYTRRGNNLYYFEGLKEGFSGNIEIQFM